MVRSYKRALVMSFVAFLLAITGSLSVAYAQDVVEPQAPRVEATVETESLQDRLEALVQQRVETLDAAKQERVAARCEAAKEKITLHKDAATAYKNSHGAVYVKMLTSLATFVSRVDAASIDAAPLKVVLSDLDQRIITLASDTTVYENAVATLLAIDCVQQPAVFYGALQSVRAAHGDILTQVAGINELIADDVRAEIIVIRDGIVAASAASATESEEDL